MWNRNMIWEKPPVNILQNFVHTCPYSFSSVCKYYLLFQAQTRLTSIILPCINKIPCSHKIKNLARPRFSRHAARIWHQTLQWSRAPSFEICFTREIRKGARQIEPWVNLTTQDESIRRPWKTNNIFSREETSFSVRLDGAPEYNNAFIIVGRTKITKKPTICMQWKEQLNKKFPRWFRQTKISEMYKQAYVSCIAGGIAYQSRPWLY